MKKWIACLLCLAMLTAPVSVSAAALKNNPEAASVNVPQLHINTVNGNGASLALYASPDVAAEIHCQGQGKQHRNDSKKILHL